METDRVAVAQDMVDSALAAGTTAVAVEAAQERTVGALERTDLNVEFAGRRFREGRQRQLVRALDMMTSGWGEQLRLFPTGDSSRTKEDRGDYTSGVSAAIAGAQYAYSGLSEFLPLIFLRHSDTSDLSHFATSVDNTILPFLLDPRPSRLNDDNTVTPIGAGRFLPPDAVGARTVWNSLVQRGTAWMQFYLDDTDGELYSGRFMFALAAHEAAHAVYNNLVGTVGRGSEALNSRPDLTAEEHLLAYAAGSVAALVYSKELGTTSKGALIDLASEVFYDGNDGLPFVTSFDLMGGDSLRATAAEQFRDIHVAHFVHLYHSAQRGDFAKTLHARTRQQIVDRKQ